QLKALLNLIGFEGEGRHRGEEERKKKEEGREEQQTTGKFCDKSEKMLRRRWGRKQPPVTKELPEEGVTGKSFLSPFRDHRFNKRRNSTGVP
ncbi:hypothetical protein PIB30_074132, partial [Stylosanthes scabra]|nr:hypothetical protein [Stylosanthes scabra]